MKSSKPTVGVDDLGTLYPGIAREWHPTKNGHLLPSDVRSRTNIKVWWQCKRYANHEWETQIAGRTDPRGGGGCPICSGKRVLVGFNDLGTTHPDLEKEWHPTKNGEVKPQDFVRGSKVKIWWICSRNPTHEWEAQILSRVQGKGCPFCSGRQVIGGETDLASQYPEIAKEWHPQKNGSLTPSQVTRASSRSVWWICKKFADHEWKASPKSRTLMESGCPICSGRQILKGFNDLVTTHPQIATQWHPTKNIGRRPTDISKGSNNKVWWVCSDHPDHEWEAVVLSRTFSNSGCPICSGHQTLKGFNDLATTHPELCEQWHPSKNRGLKPDQFSQGSNEKIWWLCPMDSTHEWKAAIHKRVNGTNCPGCTEYGFNQAEKAWFYLMQRPGEQQIGITNNLQQRLETHQRNGWMLLDTAGPERGSLVLEIEKVYKKWLRQSVGTIKGTAENWSTTSMEVQSLAELKAKSGIATDLF
jgi:hypothetical protein